jgi:hypothetical protein
MFEFLCIGRVKNELGGSMNGGAQPCDLAAFRAEVAADHSCLEQERDDVKRRSRIPAN